jgi:catechol 2,3-dioxygenase-like lactoylglutathione lyase family enzyme
VSAALSSASPFTGLSHVQLLVSDVAASAEWYRAALGLDGFVEDLSVGYVALRHGPSKVVVVLTARGRDGCPDPGSDNGPLDHLAFAVPDGDMLRAWADHLTAIGMAHDGVVLEDGRPSLQLVDPDGVAIELVAPAPRPSPDRAGHRRSGPHQGVPS